jgi:hypothetical protein
MRGLAFDFGHVIESVQEKAIEATLAKEYNQPM